MVFQFVVLTREADISRALTDSGREDKVIIVCTRVWRVNLLGKTNNAGDDTRMFIG